MLAKRENIQRILDFQKLKSKELKRPVAYSEAVAMWLTQRTITVGEKGNLNNQVIRESFIY